MKEALVDQAEAFSGRGHIAIIDPVFQGTGEWGMRVRIREGIPVAIREHSGVFCFHSR